MTASSIIIFLISTEEVYLRAVEMLNIALTRIEQSRKKVINGIKI